MGFDFKSSGKSLEGVEPVASVSAFANACSLSVNAEGSMCPLPSLRDEWGMGRVQHVGMMTDLTPDTIVSKSQELPNRHLRGQPVQMTSS